MITVSLKVAQFSHFMDKHLPQRIPILAFGGSAMRNIMAGFAVLGSLAIGTVASATAHPLSVPSVGQSLAVQQADWDGDGCGPQCWEHRREAREREWEHQRWAQHRRWEEHQRWEESRYPPPSAYGYQHRY